MSRGFIVIKDRTMIVCDNNVHSVPELMCVADVPRIFTTWQSANSFILDRNTFEAKIFGAKNLYEIEEITEEMEADIVMRRLRRKINY